MTDVRKPDLNPEIVDEEDALALAQLEELLLRKKPATFATDNEPECWHFPHDPEQWVEVRRLTAAEVRHYQALQTQLVANLSTRQLSSAEINFRATEAYLYLLKKSIVAFRFRRGDQFIEGNNRMNDEQLTRLFSELTPEVAAWLERKILVWNELTPAAQRKKEG